MMPLAILIIGFFNIKLPLLSEYPEMRLITSVKEHITNLFHLRQPRKAEIGTGEE